jgi:hypothetical protein
MGKKKRKKGKKNLEFKLKKKMMNVNIMKILLQFKQNMNVRYKN